MTNNKGSFTDRLMDAIEAFTTERHVVAVKNGMMTFVPFTVVGAISLLIAAFPSQAYTNFVTSIFGEGWQGTLYDLNNGMMNLGGILCLIFIAYNLSIQFTDVKMSPIYPTGIAFGVYVYLTHLIDGSTISMGKFGSGSVIVAIFVGLCVPELYRFLVKHNITIKLPSAVPPMVAESFAAVLPLAIIMVCACVLKKIIGLTSYEDIHVFINTVIALPLKGLVGSWWGFAILEFIQFALWGFGIHGTNIIMSGLAGPMLLMLSDENRIAWQNGLPLPNIITNEFIMFITNTGLMIAIACIVFCKNEGIKSVAKAGVIPAWFCIHEPLVFGLPIAFNPYLGAAYAIMPVVGTITTYFVVKMGLVARLTGAAVPWTTPIPLLGYLQTGGHISGAVWQLILNVIYFFLAIPFVKAYDNAKNKEEAEAAAAAEAEAENE